jgi:hypothetical protein
VAPPELMTSPPSTSMRSGVSRTRGKRRRKASAAIQWVVASLPSSTPASAARKAPVQEVATEASTWRSCPAVHRSRPSRLPALAANAVEVAIPAPSPSPARMTLRPADRFLPDSPARPDEVPRLRELSAAPQAVVPRVLRGGQPGDAPDPKQLPELRPPGWAILEVLEDRGFRRTYERRSRVWQVAGLVPARCLLDRSPAGDAAVPTGDLPESRQGAAANCPVSYVAESVNGDLGPHVGWPVNVTCWHQAADVSPERKPHTSPHRALGHGP